MKATGYKSRAAREAQAIDYGTPSYWAELDRSAQEKHDYYMLAGEVEKAARMFTRTLEEALRGNDGE